MVKAMGVTVREGSVETVAETGEPLSPEERPDKASSKKKALITSLGTVSALAMDAEDNLFVAETGPAGGIRRIERNGLISSFAGMEHPEP